MKHFFLACHRYFVATFFLFGAKLSNFVGKYLALVLLERWTSSEGTGIKVSLGHKQKNGNRSPCICCIEKGKHIFDQRFCDVLMLYDKSHWNHHCKETIAAKKFS